MKIRTFTAGTMAETLMQVKAALGGGAVILHTRTYKRGGVLGIGGKQVVEVTAAEAEPPRPRERQRATPPRDAHASQPMAGDLIRRTYAAAKAEMTRRQESNVAAPAQGDTLVTQAPRFMPQSSVSAAPKAPLPERPSVQPSISGDAGAALLEEVRATQRMVARMMQRTRFDAATAAAGADAVSPDMPGKLFDEYLSLLKQDVTEELAEEVVRGVREKLGGDRVHDAVAVRGAVREMVASLMPTDPGAERFPPTADGRPRTIALIGPTGVGKTTTIAKLAATMKIRQKKNVGLITLDTYRIAAVDQLKTYASIIGVPLAVAMSPEELGTIVRRYAAAGCDAILIDTAGRSQRDDPRLGQLKAFIAAADPHEVHLVLSSTCTQSVLLDTVERFSAVRTDRIIFTKLDEAVSFGVLLNVARKVNKRLSYVTTGQEVPHQIEPGRAERIADLVLGGGI